MHQLPRRRTKRILRWGCILFVGMIDRACMPISGERVDHLFVKVYTSIIIYKGVRSYLNVFSRVSGDTMRRRTTRCRVVILSSFEFRMHTAQLPVTVWRTDAMVCVSYRKAAFIKYMSWILVSSSTINFYMIISALSYTKR